MKRQFFFCILLAGCLLTGCQRDRYAVFSGFAQGGVYTVKADLRGVRTPAREIQEHIDALLDSIDFSLSGYNKNSLLTHYNQGEEIVPDRFFDEVRALSDRYRAQTGGAFDVASGPLFDIWGFGFTADSLPDPARVAAAIAACKEEKVLNFNAIAQGYTCDVVAAYLRGLGVENMLVDIGEIYCAGVNPAGRGWTIGVDNPVDGNDTPGKDLRGIWQSDGGACGIVTSGNYRKFYVKDGRKYAHTIDPRTGYPVTHDLLSATVVAPTAAEADALATACMVLGPEGAKALIEGRPDLEGYLITADGTWMSEGFRARTQMTDIQQK
ncbi:MAG: FAD:protein FMN transferase [Bacteroidales bacterium]|nr:FAD:protein FMN transferase [Bacteroidales bacterium]